MNRQHAVGDALRTGLLYGGLRQRVLGRAESIPGPSWLALLIENGRAAVAGEDGEIVGPALAWRVWRREARATFAPGATGCYVVLGAPALARAIGHLPEARELREFADHPATRPLDGPADGLRTAFRTLHRELGSDEAGARAIVDAYLRVILVQTYRARRIDAAERDRRLPAHHALARFGTLVESHFRERWTVGDYAARLGMSRDRLGDLCRRARGLGPKEMIDRRVALEARLQLETSSLSIQQVSEMLGFSSAPQFTRFFQRMTGTTPGQFRRQALETPAERRAERHFEWP